MEDIIFLFFSNLLCYVAYTFDKCFAETGRWRIPEFVLLLLSFLGGAFGALCGMILLPHKSQKKLFRILVPLFLFMKLFECFFKAVFKFAHFFRLEHSVYA